MENLCQSEFADEYQDWLSGHPDTKRAAWFDMPVAQLDCGAPIVVAPSSSLREVVTLMNEQRRGAVLIVRENTLVGIFTERDVLRSVTPRQLDLDDTTVGALMTPCPEALPEATTLAQALRMMVRSHHRHLPVVDGSGRPVALISMHGIIEFVSDTFAKEILNAPPERQSCAPPLDGP
jgi:signal-transduction protein with cAMP-binding, CBS, and nucleotidyltransferase domain